MAECSSMEQMIKEYEDSIKRYKDSVEKLKSKLSFVSGQDRLDTRKTIKIKEDMIFDMEIAVLQMKNYLRYTNFVYRCLLLSKIAHIKRLMMLIK